ncbi:hypothetical protein M4951_12040 [Blastopirellula sp. J2-11]|uniref:glycine-rich domain-containing protein n=1 Tax=Blastopirellula sp. J2-11 TaxID=2943192 RepID=UPI0021C6892A|nr:hypothetical protein [Blastopirellula sp. J2-11]UUO09018.1 hypothetical protein M4951_12040 [Blastopirellula sp. J2-11]
MNEDQRELWRKIERFSIDEGDEQLTFARRLARENGWSLRFAERVVEEYKRFVFLAMASGHRVTPSEQVDQAWHLHLVYSRSYWERMCQQVLGKPLHHGPTKGGAAEAEKFEDWYERTQQSYAALFGEAPPEDIWPSSAVRFDPSVQWRTVDVGSHWVIPKLSRRALTLLGGGVPLLVGAGVSPALLGAGGLPVLVKVIIVVFVLLLVVWLLALLFRSGKDSGGGCSSCGDSTGGGWFFFGDWGCSNDSGCSSDSGCGSSCGGGCGGD